MGDVEEGRLKRRLKRGVKMNDSGAEESRKVKGRAKMGRKLSDGSLKWRVESVWRRKKRKRMREERKE